MLNLDCIHLRGQFPNPFHARVAKSRTDIWLEAVTLEELTDSPDPILEKFLKDILCFFYICSLFFGSLYYFLSQVFDVFLAFLF